LLVVVGLVSGHREDPLCDGFILGDYGVGMGFFYSFNAECSGSLWSGVLC